MRWNPFKKTPHAGEIFAPKGLALRGYDVLSYFEEQPEKGNSQHSFQWKKTTWLFVNKENLNKFQQNPDRYLPQFGGYCAYGVSNGYAAKTEPGCFTIENDRLYLNYSRKYQKIWRKDMNERILLGIKNWPQIKEELIKEQLPDLRNP